MIAAYLETLAAALSFDRTLTQRVLHEVEDHLHQAIAADASHGGMSAEHHAIAEFGDAQMLAAQFAAVAAGAQVRKLGIALVVAIASVFVAMKGRIAWYTVMGSDAGHDMTTLATIAGGIDRYAFWLSAVIGAITFVIVSQPIPALPEDRSEKQRRCVLLLCLAAIGTLVLSVIGDGLLTAIRIIGAAPRVSTLVPVATMTVEIASVSVLVLLLWVTSLRAAAAASLRATAQRYTTR